MSSMLTLGSGVRAASLKLVLQLADACLMGLTIKVMLALRVE